MKLMINDKFALMPQHHFLKACGGMEVNDHPFTTSATERAHILAVLLLRKILGMYWIYH